MKTGISILTVCNASCFFSTRKAYLIKIIKLYNKTSKLAVCRAYFCFFLVYLICFI